MAAPVAFSLPSSPPPGAAPRSAPPRGVIVGICVLLVVVVAVVLWRRGRGGGGPLTPCSASRPCPEGQVCQCAGVDAGFCIPFPGGTPAAGYAWVSGWSSPVRDRAGCVAECAGRAVSAGAAHWAYYEGGGSPGGAPVGSSPNCVYGELKGGCALAAPGWTSDGGAVAAACPPDKVCPCGGTHAGKCVEPASVGVAPGYAWAWDEAMDDYTRSHAACATECASKAAAGGGSNWTYTGLVSAPGGPGGGPNCVYGKIRAGACAQKLPGSASDLASQKAPTCGKGCPLGQYAGVAAGGRACLSGADCPGGGDCTRRSCASDDDCDPLEEGPCHGGRCLVGVCAGACAEGRDCFGDCRVLGGSDDCRATPGLCSSDPGNPEECRVAKDTGRGFACCSLLYPDEVSLDGRSACIEGQCRSTREVVATCGGAAGPPPDWYDGQMIWAASDGCDGLGLGDACSVKSKDGAPLWSGRCTKKCGAAGRSAGDLACWPAQLCTTAAGATSYRYPYGVCEDLEKALGYCAS